MLYKGKRDKFYLYELTETDLIWEDQANKRYEVGNVLLFSDKKNIALGNEIIKADDLDTAYAYLDNSSLFTHASTEDISETVVSLRQQLEQRETDLQKRDDLLRDLTTDMESQRYSNQVLIAQLESLREQINIEKLSRDEVLGDLEVVSAETYRKDQELQAAITAKTQLEQELAARICELLELDSANADLQKRLEERNFDELPSSTTQTHSHLPLSVKPSDVVIAPDTEVLVAASGKQIHVYHEFSVPGGAKRGRGVSSLQGLIRVIGLLALAVLVFLTGSVIATAQLNSLSLGEALDMTLKVFIP